MFKTIRVRSNCALVCRRYRPASGTSSFTMRTDVAASDPPSDSARSPRRRPDPGPRCPWGTTPPVAVSDPNSFEDGALGPLESDAERGMERGEQEPRNALRYICVNDLQDIHIGSRCCHGRDGDRGVPETVARSRPTPARRRATKALPRCGDYRDSRRDRCSFRRKAPRPRDGRAHSGSSPQNQRSTRRSVTASRARSS